MKNVILAGNATTADILNSYLALDDRYEVVGLTVDDNYVDQGGISGFDSSIPMSKLKDAYSPQDCVVIMAMGYDDLNKTRQSMFQRIKEMGYGIETYVHPDARLYSEHPLGEGCVVLPSAVIEPHVQVGKNTMVWSNTTLAHHSSVAENCWIASGAVISGRAHVKDNCFIGVNATVVNDKTVGEYCIIGGGALITKDTKPSSVHLARSGEELRFTSEQYVKFFGI
jgi:sugar O-acyltransferase (sialic acid O-acetyltransferase NeuD family)